MTGIVSVAVVPGAMVAIVQVRLVVPATLPLVAVAVPFAFRYVVGSGSVTTTFVAIPGPALTTSTM